MNYENELKQYLSGARAEKVLALESTASTNDEAKKLALAGAGDGEVVLARCQSEGRGRLGRSFFSRSGKGVYLSYLIRTKKPLCDLSELTSHTAVAVCEAIEELYGLDQTPKIKWVNDIMMQGKKVCGILCEAFADKGDNCVVIGIGLNVNEEESDFPEEIKGIASSLLAATGKNVAVSAVAAALIAHLDIMRAEWEKGSAVIKENYLSRYRERCISTGRRVLIQRAGEAVEAEALFVGDDYSLRVRYDDGREESVFSGDVSVRGI